MGNNVEACDHGDVCFLEVRRNKPRTGTVLTQLCTGCKSAQACFDLKAQNMVTNSATPRTLLQCFPTLHLLNTGHRLGEMASVCRTCFVPSENPFDSNNAANNEEVFLKGLTATTLEIPQSGVVGGATAMQVNLQHEDVSGTTNFAAVFFLKLMVSLLPIMDLTFHSPTKLPYLANCNGKRTWLFYDFDFCISFILFPFLYFWW